MTTLICDICDKPASHLIEGICFYCWAEHNRDVSELARADAEQAREERNMAERQPLQDNTPGHVRY